MPLFSSLHHRPFALLWSGQAISRLGDSLYRIALVWWMLEATGSAAAMGTMLIFSFTPMLLFLLVGGVVVDRWPRVRVMLIADLLSGGVVTLIAGLAWAHQLAVWHVYIASTFFGLVEAFFFPAYTAAVPELTPRELLPSANSLTDLSRQLAGVVGPALGALIVTLGGTPLAFTLNALSFFFSAACLWPLRQTSAPRPEAPRLANPLVTVFADLRAGLTTVGASPWLWITIVVFGFINITASAPRAVALPFLVEETLHADVGALGLLNSMTSVGFVLGAVWLGRFAQWRRRGILAYGATLVSGAVLLVFGLPVGLPALAAAALFAGLFTSIFSLIWTNTLQELVPRELLGRVSSIDALGSFVLLPIGFGLTGWATDRLGAPMVFIVGGSATIALAALALTHPAIRHLD